MSDFQGNLNTNWVSGTVTYAGIRKRAKNPFSFKPQ